jgi:hypothetical protein
MIQVGVGEFVRADQVTYVEASGRVLQVRTTGGNSIVAQFALVSEATAEAERVAAEVEAATS